MDAAGRYFSADAPGASSARQDSRQRQLGLLYVCNKHFDDSNRSLVGSQLVALAYQYLGLYPADFDCGNVVPMDLLGYDSDTPPLPLIVQQTPTYIVSDRWAF